MSCSFPIVIFFNLHNISINTFLTRPTVSIGRFLINNPTPQLLAVLLKNNQSPDRAKCPITKPELLQLIPIDAPILPPTTSLSSSSTATTTNSTPQSFESKASEPATPPQTYVTPSPACSLPCLSLADKLHPTVEWYPQSPLSINHNSELTETKPRWCAQVANCTSIFLPLQRRVSALPHLQWSDDSQNQRGNVTLTRAAHDRLGK